jgi:hypothetical protein
MIRFLAIFVWLASMACLQIRCNAEGDSLKNKIVRAMLNQNETAVIKVGNFQTSMSTAHDFPKMGVSSKIEGDPPRRAKAIKRDSSGRL